MFLSVHIEVGTLILTIISSSWNLCCIQTMLIWQDLLSFTELLTECRLSMVAIVWGKGKQNYHNQLNQKEQLIPYSLNKMNRLIEKMDKHLIFFVILFFTMDLKRCIRYMFPSFIPLHLYANDEILNPLSLNRMCAYLQNISINKEKFLKTWQIQIYITLQFILQANMMGVYRITTIINFFWYPWRTTLTQLMTHITNYSMRKRIRSSPRIF